MSTPTAGRMVLFVLPNFPTPVLRPALVIEAHGAAADLHVFLKPFDGTADYAPCAAYSAVPAPGTWHWPPRVPVTGHLPFPAPAGHADISRAPVAGPGGVENAPAILLPVAGAGPTGTRHLSTGEQLLGATA